MALSAIVAAVAVTFAFVVFIILKAYDIFLAGRLDSREAPILHAKIPYVGHLLSMVHHGSNFWTSIKNKAAPTATIVTLNLGFGEKMHIITNTTPRLVDSFLDAKMLRLAPMLPDFMKTWAPLTKPAQDDYPMFFKRWLRVVPEALIGEAADTFHRLAMREVMDHIKDVSKACKMQGSYTVPDLAKWIGDITARALLVGFAGPDWDWVRDPKFLEAFWEYETYIPHYAVSPAPSLTAPSGYKAREDLMSRLRHWVAGLEENPKSANKLCCLARTIFELPESKEWSVHDKTAMALIMIRASLSNEGPILYWMFVHIFSQPVLLARLRAEGEAFLSPDRNPLASDGLPRDMSPEAIRAACPLLVACCMENQRLTTVGPLVRRVLRDTTIRDDDREFLMKKGSIAVLPTSVLHVSEDRWGSDAVEFNPDRFLGERAEELPRNSFFPFGSGRDECPGQYLATNILLWVMLVLIVNVDVESVDGSPVSAPAREDISFTPLPYLIWSLPHSSGQYNIRMRRAGAVGC